MPLCELRWFSDVLKKHVGTYVFIPPAGKPPFATLYLLHGLSDDYTGWQRRTRLEPYAEQHPLMVVMPDGFRGFYTNNAQGPDYARYIAEELIATIERIFPARPQRESRGVGGLSMGGYGALRLSLGFPDVFAAATSHSGPMMYGWRDKPRPGSPLGEAEFGRIFGQGNGPGSEHDLVALAQRCKSHHALPKIRIDCGTEDELLDDNRTLHAQLDKLGVEHEYEEFPGGHTWEYWDLHVREALAFHHRHLAT